MNREEKRVLVLTAPSHFLVHLLEGVLPPLIPLLITVFHTDYFHLGLVVTIFSYAFGFGSLPSGYLSDRIGPKRIVTIFLFGAGLLSIFILPVRSLLAYSVIMGCIGLFCSTYHPASNTLISHVFKEKGNAFAINGITGSLGTAAAPLLSAWLGWAFGWKSPHILFGLACIGVGIYALTLMKQPMGKTKIEHAKAEKEKQSDILYLNLVIFYASAVLLGFTNRGIMTFLPAYLGQRIQFGFIELDTVTLGGTVATFALLFGAIGQYVAGRLADRYMPEKIYLSILLIGTVWVFIMARTENILLVISAIVYAFFYFATQPVQNYLVSSYLPRHRRGLGFGIFFFLAFSVGSTAAAVSGYLADRFGLVSVFSTMGICYLITSVFGGLLLLKAPDTSSV